MAITILTPISEIACVFRTKNSYQNFANLAGIFFLICLSIIPVSMFEYRKVHDRYQIFSVFRDIFLQILYIRADMVKPIKM